MSSPSPQPKGQQTYDNLLKRLVQSQYTTFIPLLLAQIDIQVNEELSIESLPPPDNPLLKDYREIIKIMSSQS